MSTTEDRAGTPSSMEHISREECLALISALSVGRLAVALPHRAPLVVPVNYVVYDGAVLFRTDPGSKLEALHDHPVSFQVDQIDQLRHTGWSVLLRGFAHEVSPAALPLEPWVGGSKEHWVRVQVEEVSGRRILERDVLFDARGYL
jgi:nitroimidazol reductase NimA-like FMN-containing flavoprotein (pyridoxamine 5'-phosphate oxidase superfamily)